MSMSKGEPPLKTQKLDRVEGPNSTSVVVKTMEDLPPDVLKKILQFLTRNFNRNKMLRLRLVNSEWKSVLDSLLEKKLVSGKFRPFPALQILGTLPHNMWIRYSPTTFATGLNPFPFNSLVLTDQLVNLILGTNEPLPALQKGHRYYHPLPRLKTFTIATTSLSAFGKLKQLKLYRPGTPFLRFSETPALENLSVIREGDDTRVYLEDLAIFIGNCGSGLKMVHLDLIWSEMMGRVNAREFPEGKKVVPSLEGVVVSSLRTLSVTYPNTDAYEGILSKEFILLFPSLEKLNFLYYKPSEYDFMPPLAQLNRNVNGAVEGNKEKVGDEITALKASLDPIWRRMVVINGNLWEARVKAKIDEHKFVQKAADFEAGRRQRAEIKELQGSMVAVRNERAGIIRRLATALGEKREKVIVEQLLQRGGYRLTCPNLKVVSVSSSGIVKGNVCTFGKS